jgi:alkaline phosphatase D
MCKRKLLIISAMQPHHVSEDAHLSTQQYPSTAVKPHTELPLLLQVADVHMGGACVWVWHGFAIEIVLQWQVNGIPQEPLFFPLTQADTGWTSTLTLQNLPADSVVTLAACITDTGLCATTYFSTPAAIASKRPVRFAWGGDVCGQSYGRHAEFGMPVFETLRKQAFDFFILCGDLIYADHSIPATRSNSSDEVWPNALDNPLAKAVGLPEHVAQAITTDDFRTKYLYLWADASFRKFVTATPMVYVLDDHEIYNNWTRDTSLAEDARYPSDLAFKDLRDRGLLAWHEYAPSLNQSLRAIAPGFNIIHYGALLDVFILDVRSQRSANSTNRQTTYDQDAHWLGPKQLQALINALLASTAVWKVIVSGNPLSVMVQDSDALHAQAEHPLWDGVSNGDHGVPSGREIELSMLLSAINNANLDNLVFLSGDVHFSTAVHYDPQRAAFTDFKPFWEFVSGPLHAGGFQAKEVDRTFGAQQEFVRASPEPAIPPGATCTAFGKVEIDPSTAVMTVSLCNFEGVTEFTQTLAPLTRSQPSTAAF